MAMRIDTEELDSETRIRMESLGHVTMSESAKDIIDENEIELVDLFKQYVGGDYGEVKYEDAWNNDVAMYSKRGRVKAVYTTKSGRRLTIMTTWNQPVTAIKELDE